MFDAKLVHEVRKYLRGLPSHVRERQGAKLLQQLLEAYEKHARDSTAGTEGLREPSRKVG